MKRSNNLMMIDVSLTHYRFFNTAHVGIKSTVLLKMPRRSSMLTIVGGPWNLKFIIQPFA